MTTAQMELVIDDGVDKSKSLTYKEIYPLIVRNRWAWDISERMLGVRKTGSGVEGR